MSELITNKKTMSTRELAEFFGVSYMTLLRKARVYDIKFWKGQPKKWTKEEISLMSEAFRKDTTDLHTLSGEVSKVAKEKESNLENMFIAFMQQQQETNKLLLSLIQNNQKQLSEPKPEINKITVSEFFKKNNIRSFNIKSLAIATGKQATRLSKDLNRNIQYKFNEESEYSEGCYDEDLMETALMVAKKLIEKNNTLFSETGV